MTYLPQHPKQTLKDTSMPKDLFLKNLVFARRDSVKNTLQPVYEGQFRGIDKAEEYFTIKQNGHTDNVSTDRIKLAHVNKPKQTMKPQTFTPDQLKEDVTDHTKHTRSV